MNNFDVAVLLTGDGDFLPAVEEVQRLGKRVHLGAFQSGLSEELQLSSDTFFDIGEGFLSTWKKSPPKL